MLSHVNPGHPRDRAVGALVEVLKGGPQALRLAPCTVRFYSPLVHTRRCEFRNISSLVSNTRMLHSQAHTKEKGLMPKGNKQMKSRTLSRWRAPIAGATLALATIFGSFVTSTEAFAATTVTNLVATYNSSTQKIDVSWTDTGVAGDTYSVSTIWNGGSVCPALDDSNQPLSGLTTTTASFSKCDADGVMVTPAGPHDLQPGDTFSVRVTTTSTDASTSSAQVANVVFGGINYASAPTNVAVADSPTNSYPVLTWGMPTQSGDTAITGWRIALTQGLSVVSDVVLNDPAQTSYDLGANNALLAGQQYSVSIAAVNGTDGVSPNNELLQFIASVNTSVQDGSTPNAPNTGFTLNLASPAVVIAGGLAAVAALAIAGRRLLRR